MSLLHREKRLVVLPLLFPSLPGGPAWLEQEAGEGSPPPGVTEGLPVVCPARAQRPAQPVCREAMVARCAGPSFPSALSSPWSGGQGISAKSTRTRDRLNPSQLLQVQEKQIHQRGATSSCRTHLFARNPFSNLHALIGQPPVTCGSLNQSKLNETKVAGLPSRWSHCTCSVWQGALTGQSKPLGPRGKSRGAAAGAAETRHSS